MKVTGVYDHFFKHEEITNTLKGYQENYPECCRLHSLAKTAEGRDIWMIEITDLSTGGFDDKPGFGVTGNIHAGEVTGNCCAMHFLDYLFTNIKEEEVAWLLKQYTVYCVPRISPDGSELYLTSPTMLRSVPAMYPYEEPMPGMQPKDLDGDGVIRQIRVKDPNGCFKISEKDPRLMVKREPDDVEGTFYHVYSEGIIQDYHEDKEIKSAPSLYGNDLNRNFPISWAPENRQAGAGAYALSNIESAALAKFIEAHKNLCTILHFHTMGGQYLFPPGCEPSRKAHKEDMIRYRQIGAMATEETTYPCWNVRDEYMGSLPGEILGLFDDFNHFAMGLVNYTCECWDLDVRSGFGHICPNREKTDEEVFDMTYRRLKWIDEENDGVGFLDWTPFHHPQLGDVEIGGFDYKGVIQNAPAKFLEQEVEKNTRFLLREMKTLPRLYFRDTKVTPLGEKQFRVETTVANSAYLPTYVTREAVDVGRAREVTAQIAGAEVIVGKEKEEIGHLNGYWGNANYGWGLGGTTANHTPMSRKLSWVVEAEPGTEVTVVCGCPRAGKVSQKIIL